MEEYFGIFMSSVFIVSHVRVGMGEKGCNGDWARGMKLWQFTLSMVPARAEVPSYVQRATIQSKRVIPYIKYS
jgi:hypothetical protein